MENEGGITMDWATRRSTRRTLAGCGVAVALATGLLAVAPADAAPPAPSAAVDCVVGNVTTVSWRHLRGVTRVDVVWLHSNSLVASQGIDVSSKGATGRVAPTTPPSVVAGDQASVVVHGASAIVRNVGTCA